MGAGGGRPPAQPLGLRPDQQRTDAAEKLAVGGGDRGVVVRAQRPNVAEDRDWRLCALGDARVLVGDVLTA